MRLLAIALCALLLTASNANSTHSQQSVYTFNLDTFRAQDSVSGPTGTYDISIDWSMRLLQDLTAPHFSTDEFRLEVNGTAVATVSVPITIQPGSGPSACTLPLCDAICGSVDIDGLLYTLQCDSSDCSCASPVVSTVLVTSVPLVFPDEIKLIRVPGDSRTDEELGSMIWGSINRRVAQVLFLPRSSSKQDQFFDIWVDVSIDMSADSSLPLDLIPGPIVSIDCDTSTEDCGGCCGEACDCTCSKCKSHVVQTEMVSMSLSLVPPLDIAPACEVLGTVECGTATFDDGESSDFECDPQNGRCTLSMGRYIYENVSLSPGTRIVVRMDYENTSLPELYIDNDVLDFIFDGATYVPPVAAGARLFPCYPNPFNPRTNISFELPQPGHVKLDVLTVDGRRVATILDGRIGAGRRSVVWEGTDDRGQTVASGVYVVRMSAQGSILTQRVAILK